MIYDQKQSNTEISPSITSILLFSNHCKGLFGRYNRFSRTHNICDKIKFPFKLGITIFAIQNIFRELHKVTFQ